MTTATFQEFLDDHKSQLECSGVPEFYWPTIYQKLLKQTFDAGNVFTLMKIDYDGERDPYDPVWQLQIHASDGIQCDDAKHIYLVDHTWTFQTQYALRQLEIDETLRIRMASIMGLNLNEQKEQLAMKIFNEMWKYCCFYYVGSATSVERRLPVWFIMDEVGSAIQHSDTPNFRMIPFLYLPEQLGLSVIYPIKNVQAGDVVTRDFVEGTQDPLIRSALLIPWKKTSFLNKNFDFIPQGPQYYLTGHIRESLPIIENLKKKQKKKDKYKVYCEYSLIKKFLTDSRFQFVSDEDDADILWYIKHFKRYQELSEMPNKFVNQFPFEYIITIKDLLCITCRQKNTNNFTENLDSLPEWLPTTYNLQTEVPQFVAYFQKREQLGLGNYWITKPFNLARGLDMYISNDLNYILRSATTIPKVVQKYIENPVLFNREEIGNVKFDLRYVIILTSVKPLQVYVYKEFFLRFANRPFELNSFHEYEKHYTVMNYTENAVLKHMLCSEFKERWQQQYSKIPWHGVEKAILRMLKEIFECAVIREPPCGICESPQSRAVYAADIMLEWKGEDTVQPKILEINWTPDCERACDYYNNFYNDIFKLLFLNELNTDTIRQI